MSKNSPKSTYVQLVEWLPTLRRTQLQKQEKNIGKFSKADHYKSKGV